MKRIFYFLFLLTLVVIGIPSCTKECTCNDEPEWEQKTLSTQPGPSDGQDCLVGYRTGDNGFWASSNLNANPDICASQWTYAAENAGDGTVRAYLKFDQVSEIPSTAVIKSARLSLYGLAPNTGTALPQGNSGDNKTWLKRVTDNWTESSITWNNKPGTSNTNEVALPASTAQWGFDVTDINVTNLVKDMVATGQNYGFCLQLQTEQIYRGIVFASSEVADATKRPKLVVEYEIEKP